MIKVPRKAVKNINGEMIPVYQMDSVAEAMRRWLKGDITDTMFIDYIDIHFGMRSVEKFKEFRNDPTYRHYPHDFMGCLVFHARPQPPMRTFTKREMFTPVKWV